MASDFETQYQQFLQVMETPDKQVKKKKLYLSSIEENSEQSENITYFECPLETLEDEVPPTPCQQTKRKNMNKYVLPQHNTMIGKLNLKLDIFKTIQHEPKKVTIQTSRSCISSYRSQGSYSQDSTDFPITAPLQHQIPCKLSKQDIKSLQAHFNSCLFDLQKKCISMSHSDKQFYKEQNLAEIVETPHKRVDSFDSCEISERYSVCQEIKSVKKVKFINVPSESNEKNIPSSPEQRQQCPSSRFLMRSRSKVILDNKNYIQQLQQRNKALKGPIKAQPTFLKNSNKKFPLYN